MNEHVAGPRSGETSIEEMARLFDEQHRLSRSEPAPDLSLRLDRLARLRALIAENRTAVADAVSADFGNRSPDETGLLEVVPALNAVRHARRNVKRWMRPERRPVDMVFQPARAWVRHEPLGVVGIISPWNYPLLLALAPLVDALAAGNRAMLKPSEMTPRFSEVLQRLVVERFDPGEVTVATGGVDVAEAFSRLPFDHLVFTGSTSVGRKVMQAAAANLTPVTLELGGKSPAIVCPGYPADKAAESIAFGKFLNGGQTCIAPDYALVPKAEVGRFADAVLAAADKRYPTIAENGDYTAMITGRHFERLARAIDEAEAGGAVLRVHEDAGTREARKIGPTVVTGVPPDSLLMREEIFGPVLPVIGYDDLDGALRFVRERDRPLALYCFSDDKAERERVLTGATSGGVTVNGTLLHIAQDTLPFGGIGASGIGAYHGRDGFRRLSHQRAVYEVGRFNGFERMLGPPYGRFARGMIGWLTRR